MERHELKLLQLNFGTLAYAQLNVFLEKHTKPYSYFGSNLMDYFGSKSLNLEKFDSPKFSKENSQERKFSRMSTSWVVSMASRLLKYNKTTTQKDS